MSSTSGSHSAHISSTLRHVYLVQRERTGIDRGKRKRGRERKKEKEAETERGSERERERERKRK